MRAIYFQEANTQLGPPPGMSDEECYTVSAYCGKDDAGYNCTITAWLPNKEDLEALNAGRPLLLKVLQVPPPPVALLTIDENGNANI